MVIDFHTHFAIDKIYPDYWLSGMGEDLKESFLKEKNIPLKDDFVQNLVRNSLKDYDGQKMIREMDEGEISQSVVLLADLHFEEDPDISRLEEIYQIHFELLSRYPGRLVLFGGVDPRRGDAGLDLFQRGIESYGFKGLKLYPPCGFELNEPALFPFYELCSQYRMPVLTHVGPSLKGMKNDSLYPESILEVAERFPDVPFVLGHAAINHFEMSKDLPLQRDNIYLEVSGFQMQMEDREIIAERMRYLFDCCPEKILFGTDWPLFYSKGSQKSNIKYFRSTGILSDEEQDLFFMKNAQRLLNTN